MSKAAQLTTTLSTKGQVILPKTIRQSRNWSAGTRLMVEDTEAGVLIKAAPFFPPTKIEDVFGCLKYAGPARTVEEMNAAVLEEARIRHERIG